MNNPISMKNKSYDSSEWKLFQKYQLYTLLRFKDLCERYNLEYHLVSGTLLGAVRDGAMIPWDDDVDVGMPYKDFKKLEKIMAEAPSEFGDFRFISKFNESTFPYEFGKFSFLKISCDVVCHDSPYLWVDVFPMFKWKSDNKCRFIMRLIRTEYFEQYDDLTEKEIKFAKFCKKFKLYKIGRFLLNCSKFKLGKDFWYLTTKEEHVPGFTSYVSKSMNGFSFNVPNTYDSILRYMYGDYFTLPKDRSKYQFVTTIDFGGCNDKEIDWVLRNIQKREVKLTLGGKR